MFTDSYSNTQNPFVPHKRTFRVVLKKRFLLAFVCFHERGGDIIYLFTVYIFGSGSFSHKYCKCETNKMLRCAVYIIVGVIINNYK